MGIGTEGISFQSNNFTKNELNLKIVVPSWGEKATSRFQALFSEVLLAKNTPGMKIYHFFLRMVIDIYKNLYKIEGEEK